MNKIYLISSALIFYSIAMGSNDSYSIKVNNASHEELTITHPIPALTNATINVELTKIDLQKMLCDAMLSGSLEGVREAIRLGVDVNDSFRGSYPLVFAVLLKDNESIDLLLNAGANTECLYQGCPIVCHALNQKNLATVKKLLEHGASVHAKDSRDRDIMDYAFAAYGNSTEMLPVIDMLVQYGYRVDNMPYSVWSSVMNSGVGNILINLLNAGANPNQIVQLGDAIWTPLAIAAVKGSVAYVKELLKVGADVNQTVRLCISTGGYSFQEPCSLVSIATKFGYYEIVSLLIEHGAFL